jgi:polyisoprenoid-binding protein YceI
MNRLVLLGTASFALMALPAAAIDVSKNPKSAPKGAYEMDPSHTTLTFCVMHMGLANYCGRFNKAEGALTFNGAEPEKSKISVTIDATSIDTTSDALDGKLRDDLFKTGQFPTATFKSTKIAVTGENAGAITGELTLRGVTKPVTLKVTFNGGLMHPFANAYAIGFSGEGKFKRSDFGMTDVAWNQFVSDDVSLYIDAEFVAKK